MRGGGGGRRPGSRRGERRWRRWLVLPRVMGLVSRLLWCGRSRCSLRWQLWRRLRLRSRQFELVLVQVLALTAWCRLSCPLSWLLVTLARLLALMVPLPPPAVAPAVVPGPPPRPTPSPAARRGPRGAPQGGDRVSPGGAPHLERGGHRVLAEVVTRGCLTSLLPYIMR